MFISTTARSTATSSACAASSARSIPNSTRSPPSMARGIVLPMKADTRNHDGQKPEGSIAEQEESPLVWSARWSLTTRILAVNILAVALLAGGFYYLRSEEHTSE